MVVAGMYSSNIYNPILSRVSNLCTPVRCLQIFTPFTGNARASLFGCVEHCGINDILSATPAVAASSAQASLKRKPAYNSQKKALTKFSKRKKTLLRKAYKLSSDCDSNVFLVIRRHNKYSIYTSEPNNPIWPPSSIDIVRKRLIPPEVRYY